MCICTHSGEVVAGAGRIIVNMQRSALAREACVMSCMLVLSSLYLMSKWRQDRQGQQKEMVNSGWSSLCPPPVGLHGDPQHGCTFWRAVVWKLSRGLRSHTPKGSGLSSQGDGE